MRWAPALGVLLPALHQGDNDTPAGPHGASSEEVTGVVGVLPSSARHVAALSFSFPVCKVGMRIHTPLPGCCEGQMR